MSALSELRLRFDLPSGNPAYFCLIGGVATRELDDALRHVSRLCASELDLDDVRLLQHGDLRDRALAAAALLFLPATPPMLGKLWKALERGEKDALFTAFALRAVDAQFVPRAERLLKKLWNSNAHARASEVLSEAMVADSTALTSCAELVAALPECAARAPYAMALPRGKAQLGRERFIAGCENALRTAQGRPRATTA